MKPQKRKTVRDVAIQPVGMFAVFRHSRKLMRAHFCALHETYESASAEAIRLLTESVALRPDVQHNYYVTEVAGMFEAGPEGLKSSER